MIFFLVVGAHGRVLEECTDRRDADRITRAYHRAGVASARVVESGSPGGVKFH
jgi:hypothetical protein